VVVKLTLLRLGAFKGRDPVRTKTVIDNKGIEQVNLFNYLGNIFYEGELDIDNKLNNFLKITDNLNNVFRQQKSFRKTRIKPYNTLALTVLIYGSETWTIKASDVRRITAAEMKFEKNSRIHLDRLQNKCTNCKGVKNNTNFVQINGIQEKLDTACKLSASK